MTEPFYRHTTSGVAVAVSTAFDNISIAQSASVRDSGSGHVPFVSVALFMAPDEARELAALLLAAVEHALREKGRA